MKVSNDLIEDYRRKLEKALARLEYSFAKVQKLPLRADAFDDESLETWESFCSRFSKVIDLFLTKYIKARVLREDPGFEGTLRDFVNQAEKMNLIESADRWMIYRELRNSVAHDYTEEELVEFFDKFLKATPEIVAIRSKIAR
jgi:hypothetical protein